MRLHNITGSEVFARGPAVGNGAIRVYPARRATAPMWLAIPALVAFLALLLCALGAGQ